MVLYPFLLSQSRSTTVPNFMLVSGKAQSDQNLALSRLAIIISSLIQHPDFRYLNLGIILKTFTHVNANPDVCICARGINVSRSISLLPHIVYA